jgi:hypothetical protein
MKKLKVTEEVVLKALEENKRARSDDFILYGAVLKRLGVDLKNTNLYDFLATAKQNKMPTFETCSRARRKIQEYRQDLIDVDIAVIREDRKEKIKDWIIGGKYE